MNGDSGCGDTYMWIIFDLNKFLDHLFSCSVSIAHNAPYNTFHSDCVRINNLNVDKKMCVCLLESNWNYLIVVGGWSG